MTTPATTDLGHLAPVGSAIGTEALCGYRITNATPRTAEETCPRCLELAAAPANERMLAVLSSHTHRWEPAGADLKPGGYTPVYRCTVCGDEVTDLSLLRSYGPAGAPDLTSADL